MKNPIVHVEIPADAAGALVDFYRELFGWEFQQFPGDMEYHIAKAEEGGTTPAIMARQHPQQTPIFYVQVDSIDTALDKAGKLGAEVLVPKSPVPGMGWFAVLMDPQKNQFGFWQNDTAAA
jgi:uncharacterized protein